MNKRKVRCTIAYAEAGGIYNHKVYWTWSEGFSANVLVSCTYCGEIFVINQDNPATAGLTINEIAGNQLCPNCGEKLEETIKEYPETFRTKGGMLGSCIHPNRIPPDDETMILEFWEIIPGG